MNVMAGYIVVTPRSEERYKVVLEHCGDRPDSEHPVSSIQEGEALIRLKMPARRRAGGMREYGRSSAQSGVAAAGLRLVQSAEEGKANSPAFPPNSFLA
jgi:hypothetical protein